MWDKTAVLAVVRFQAGEVPLQPVGGGRYSRVIEVVEHIGQGVFEHAAGAFNVAEDPAGLLPGGYFGAVAVLPFIDDGEKCVSFRSVGDPGDLEKDLAQPPGIGGLRITPAPDQPLPDHRIAPAEGATAAVAKPPLPAVRIATISYGHIPALRTVFLGDITP